MPNTDKIQSTFTSNMICHFILVHFMVDDPFTGVLGVCDMAGSRGWEGCRVTSVGRGQGLPHAGRSQLQQTHCRVPLSHGWDASGKAYLRKGRKGHTETRREQTG